jgi:hypothetical protein
MRVIPPHVRIVTKDVSWESTRDEEFTEALRDAVPAVELEGWFYEFTAAREDVRISVSSFLGDLFGGPGVTEEMRSGAQ